MQAGWIESEEEGTSPPTPVRLLVRVAASVRRRAALLEPVGVRGAAAGWIQAPRDGRRWEKLLVVGIFLFFWGGWVGGCGCGGLHHHLLT